MSGTDQSLAQCRLDANSPVGTKFQRDYAAGRDRPTERDDAAYGAFLITCMEAKGYKYASPWGSDGKIDEACWIKNDKGMPRSAPWIGGAGMLPPITNVTVRKGSNLNALVRTTFKLFVVMALAGCSASNETTKTVAQCQLDADSPAGLAYRKSKMGADFDRYTKSYDYNLFMIKCMEAKGYSFPREGDANYEGCWSKNVDSAGVQNPNVDSPPCYTKK